MLLYFPRVILFLLINFCRDVVGITAMVALLFSLKNSQHAPFCWKPFWGSLEIIWAMFLLRTGESFLIKFCKPYLGINYSDSQYTSKTFWQIVLLCCGPSGGVLGLILGSVSVCFCLFVCYWLSVCLFELYFCFSGFSH